MKAFAFMVLTTGGWPPWCMREATLTRISECSIGLSHHIKVCRIPYNIFDSHSPLLPEESPRAALLLLRRAKVPPGQKIMKRYTHAHRHIYIYIYT